MVGDGGDGQSKEIDTGHCSGTYHGLLEFVIIVFALRERGSDCYYRTVLGCRMMYVWRCSQLPKQIPVSRFEDADPGGLWVLK